MVLKIIAWGVTRMLKWDFYSIKLKKIPELGVKSLLSHLLQVVDTELLPPLPSSGWHTISAAGTIWGVLSAMDTASSRLCLLLGLAHGQWWAGVGIHISGPFVLIWDSFKGWSQLQIEVSAETLLGQLFLLSYSALLLPHCVSPEVTPQRRLTQSSPSQRFFPGSLI